MLIAPFALLAAIVGLLMFALAAGKVMEIGRCLMLAGFIAMLISLTGTVKVF